MVSLSRAAHQPSASRAITQPPQRSCSVNSGGMSSSPISITSSRQQQALHVAHDTTGLSVINLPGSVAIDHLVVQRDSLCKGKNIDMMSGRSLPDVGFVVAAVFGPEGQMHTAHAFERADIADHPVLRECPVQPQAQFAQPDFVLVGADVG